PSTYNPIANPQKALERRAYVLGRMLKLEMISSAEYETAMAAPVTAAAHGIRVELKAPYFAEMVRAYMVDRYGDDAYSGGFDVYTTIRLTMQQEAQASLRRGLLDYDRRHGWRGAKASIAADVLDDAEALATELKQLSRIGELTPAVVLEANRDILRVISKDGLATTLTRPHWQWKPYRNQDYVGPQIENAEKIAQRGDVVHLLEQAEGQQQLVQVPEVEGALVALESNTGAVLAVAGGFDFYKSKFNRATQAKRQPGSSFKPFVYAAALSGGYTPATIVNDTPVVFGETLSSQDWRPENYSGKFFGPTRLRDALTYSRNMVSVKLVDSLGFKKTLDYIERFGFVREDHPSDLTVALGSGVSTPFEIARGYATFANGGFLVTPYFVDEIRVTDEVVFKTSPPQPCVKNCYQAGSQDTPVAETISAETEISDSESVQFLPQVIPADIAYQVSSMLQSVTRLGTGRKVYRTLKRRDLAGKTGTTNKQRDAWFSGFNRDIVCTVWVGYDNQKLLGNRETGAVAALPIWIDFMQKALAGTDETTFYRPPQIISAKIDKKTGALAHPSDTNAISETFRKKYLPKKTAPVPGQKNKEEDLEELF
ncbi:MAG: peptidase, partial [Gammaproteobacteria bacterium]|nr:peptidase [Gammaproteobacteria bacterium]